MSVADNPSKIMKILVVSAADATNLSIENVVKEFIRRGHVIDVFSPMQDEKTIRMFKSLGLNIYPIDGLQNRVKEYDIAFVGTDAMDYLRFTEIYVFGYNFLFNGNPSDGADFMFTLSKDRKLAHPESCAVMPMGVPKNDTEPVSCPQKQFLYIDAGHIPFGETGKRQVAGMLLEICSRFPEYQLVIKPRWLLSDKENLTHANKNHIYKVIHEISGGNIPSNMVMLDEHKDMHELMDESMTVITTSISCFVDCALRNRNCLVVGDLTSEDQHEMRLNKSRAREYREAENAGVLAGYQEISSFLPKGKRCDEDYINRLIAYKSGVSEKIVDVVEWVFERFIAEGKYPRIREYAYEGYQSGIEEDGALNMTSLKQHRMLNGIIRLARKLDYVDAPIDFSGYYEELEKTYKNYAVTQDGYHALLKDMESIYRNIIIENAALLEKDAINQSILLQAYFDEGLYDDIVGYDFGKVLCKGPYYYWIGRTLQKTQPRNKTAIVSCYLLFLREANRRTFEKYNVEHAWGMVSAYNYVLLNAREPEISDDEILELYYSLIESGLYKKVNEKAFEKIHHRIAGIIIDGASEINTEQLFPAYVRGSRWEERIVKKKTAYVPSERKKIKKSLKGSVFLSIFRIFLKDMTAGYREYAKILKKHNRPAKMFLTAGGTGDVFISNGYYSAMLEENQCQETSILVTPGEGCYQTTKMFDIQYVYQIEREQWQKLLFLLRFVGEEKLHAELLYYHIFSIHTGCLTNLEGYGGWNLHSLIREVHFPAVSRSNVPFFHDPEDMVNKIFTDHQLQYGKTVILAPYAKWPPKIIGGFWERMALELKQLGYTVCTNSVGESEPPVEGTVAVEFSYEISVPFVEKAGYIIGLRSGFLDIIESAAAKKVALYPFNCKKRGLVNESAMGSFSLNEMFQRTDWLELETDLVNLGDVIQEILEFFEREQA